MDLDAWVLSWGEIEYLAQQKKDVRVVSVDGSVIQMKSLLSTRTVKPGPSGRGYKVLTATAVMALRF